MSMRVIAIVLLCVVLINGVAFGQAPTTEPTITPTPAWQEVVTLNSGGELLIERRITYGDIALVCAVGAVGVLILCYMAIRVPKLWI